MLEYVKSEVAENLEDVYTKYPKCMFVVLDMNDDWHGTTTVKVYAVSRSDESYIELCELNKELFNKGFNSSILGDYEEGYVLNVQYFSE